MGCPLRLLPSPVTLAGPPTDRCALAGTAGGLSEPGGVRQLPWRWWGRGGRPKVLQLLCAGWGTWQGPGPAVVRAGRQSTGAVVRVPAAWSTGRGAGCSWVIAVPAFDFPRCME